MNSIISRLSMVGVHKIIFLILFVPIGVYTKPLMADDYEIDAQNLSDGTIVVTYDLLIEPELDEVFKSDQYFSHFKNLRRFNKSIKNGYPQVLSKQITLSVDPDMEYNLRIVESRHKKYKLNSPYLVGRGRITRKHNPKKIPYRIDKRSRRHIKYPSKQIEYAEKFSVRNVSGYTFRFNITQYNIKKNTVKLYTHLVFELVPKQSGAPFNAGLRDNRVIPEINRVLPHLFMNYEDDSIAKSYESRSSAGDILVIYTARDENAIQPYILHKQSLGFEVDTRKVATGTNVKSAIQSAYSQNPNIFYVQLVGDWADIKSDTGTQYNAPMDPMLGCVSGNDNYPDLAVGRFSASSPGDVTVQVNKTIAYEQNPDQSFWNNGLGIGSGEGIGDDGEIDYEHIDVIKENKLLPNQYYSVGEIYSSGTASQVASFINSGTHVINYCGHGSSTGWGTTGFSSSNVVDLSNNDKLPIIFSVACLNGTFHTGTCFAEAWLRKSGGGAAATLMAAISQPWQPPMRGQDYMNDLLTDGYDYVSNPGSGTSTTSGKGTFGEIVVNAFLLMMAESSTTSDWDTVKTWTTFGDAALKVVDEGQGTPGDTYSLKVNNGSGDGSYLPGTTIIINADDAPSGKSFDHWVINSGNLHIADVNAPTAMLITGSSAADVSATYTGGGSQCYSSNVTLNLMTDNYGSETSWDLKNESGATLHSGRGYSSYTNYSKTFVLDEGNYIFTIYDTYGDGLTVGNGSYQLTDFNGSVIINSGDFGTTESTTFCIEGSGNVDTYDLNVNNGSGDGRYFAGAYISITADTSQAEKRFDRWVVNSGDPHIADVNSAITTLTMPAGAVTVTATFKDTQPSTYNLAVNSGSGDGSYEAGMNVAISADAAPSGEVFDFWYVEYGYPGIANCNASTTTFTMPAGEVSLTAMYTLSSPNDQGIEIGSITVSQPNSTIWRKIGFDNAFSEPPIVIMGPLSYNGGDPTTVRVRNITAEGFEFQFDEWDYRDGAHTTETVSYMALTHGMHQWGSLMVLAGKIDDVNHQWQKVGFAKEFISSPVLLAQQVSDNDFQAAAIRLNNVDTAGFAIAIQEEELNRSIDGGQHTDEQVNYVAVAQGTGSIGDGAIKAGSTAKEVNDAWYQIDFGDIFIEPHFFAAIQTCRGADTATLRYKNLTEDSVRIMVEEEQSKDSETAHKNEVAGWILVTPF